MHRLENKVPPPGLLALAGLLTFLVDRFDPDESPLSGPAAVIVAVLLGLAGVVLGVLGVRRFRSAGTTVDPHSIDKASTLVVDGVYRFTRNPMYLGLVLLSIAWGLRLGTIVGLVVGTGALVVALTVLQIRPEERVLGQRFGDEYEQYRTRVRRWL